jgi:nucleosome assembly protein 1-like 1
MQDAHSTPIAEIPFRDPE